MLGLEGASNWVELTKRTRYTQFVFINDYSLQERVFPLKIASILPYRSPLVHHRAQPSRDPRETGQSQCIVGAELPGRARSGSVCLHLRVQVLNRTAKVLPRGPSAPTTLMRGAGKQDHRIRFPRCTWAVPGSLRGRKLSWWGGVSAHLGGDGSGEAGAVVGVGEDGRDRASFPQRTGRGWCGKRLRGRVVRSDRRSPVQEEPAETGSSSAFLPTIFKPVLKGKTLQAVEAHPRYFWTKTKV